MSIFIGIARLARFRSDGFAHFSATTQGVANSLAPLLAFPLVGAVLQLAQGQGHAALADLLATIIALLAPLVLTHALAARWGRQAEWNRYATASNWCQWALPAMFVAMLMAMFLLASMGVVVGPEGSVIVLLGVVGYGIALHWFLARRGLDLPRGRAMVLVLVTDISTAALVLAPRLLADAMTGSLF